MECHLWTLQLLVPKDMFVILGPTPVLSLIFSVLLVTSVTLVQLSRANSVFCAMQDLGALQELGSHRGIDFGVSLGSTVHLDLFPVPQKQVSVLLGQLHYHYQLPYPTALLIQLVIYVM